LLTISILVNKQHSGKYVVFWHVTIQVFLKTTYIKRKY
jgi:hypothetical protein